MTDRRLHVDPQLAGTLKALPMGPNGLFDLTDIPATREALLSFVAPDEVPTAVAVEEYLATRPDGPDVPIRLLRPLTAGGPLPVLVWFHGGGQVLGFAAQDDSWLKPLCETIGCAIAAVDYRLAPETQAPGAAEDGLAAWRWLGREAGRLGLDGARIGIAGQSGGGGIAAATALLIRDSGAAAPLFQSLLYPMIDDRDRTASSHEITGIGIWDRATNVLAWKAILGERYGTDDVAPSSAPARATELAGLPPTFIAVGELDCFRDEDLDFAMRLREHGVPVELHLYPGAYHAFDLFAPQSRLGSSLRANWLGYVSRQFAAAG
ncbi:alpha/beta hydrolase fold domain-containing protein [Lentzea sp. NPDC058436]|uniref:alpha/beta hydrolase fold domain-containing protein n=1 Tax=Lentzea sp. NPDC058436 TaxID=3346499 RepID=UPI00365BFBDE